MVYKRLSAMLLAAMLAVTMFSGCGEKKQKKNDQVTAETQTQQATQEDTQSKAAQADQYPAVTSEGKIKDYNSVVTVNDTAYELYTYMDKVAENYAKCINKTANALKGTSDVYDLVIPLSSGITFPDNLKEKIQSSDQQEAMKKIQDKMNKKVISVDVYDVLMQHRQEYEYFRTDHHWTTLGAYYAYTEFCKAKGIEPEALDSYETKDFDGFLGSFYNDTSDAKLKANPDVVTVYYPNSESIMHVTASDGQKYDWPVIYDVTNYSAGLKYSTFIASDNPYTLIENKDLDDKSSCIVVKESFGNAFIPFLVDHYQKIYVIDYRYWTGSISKLAKDKKVKDVLFLNNLSMIRNKSLVAKLYRVL